MLSRSQTELGKCMYFKMKEADIEADLIVVALYLHSLSIGNQEKRFAKAIKLKERYFLSYEVK